MSFGSKSKVYHRRWTSQQCCYLEPCNIDLQQFILRIESAKGTVKAKKTSNQVTLSRSNQSSGAGAAQVRMQLVITSILDRSQPKSSQIIFTSCLTPVEVSFTPWRLPGKHTGTGVSQSYAPTRPRVRPMSIP